MKKYIIIGLIIVSILTISITIFIVDLQKDTENSKIVMEEINSFMQNLMKTIYMVKKKNIMFQSFYYPLLN